MKTAAAWFVFFALYTPALWLMSHLSDNYGGVDNAPVLLQLLIVVLVGAPVLVLINSDKIFGRDANSDR